ncbi:ribonuclease H-like domain-containing protein [Tanacetum coccineum]
MVTGHPPESSWYWTYSFIRSHPSSSKPFLYSMMGDLFDQVLETDPSAFDRFVDPLFELEDHVSLGRAPIYSLSRSSAEAEYRGVANAVAETCWLRNLLRELHTPLATATLVYCDNVSAVYLSSNPMQHQRTKHIEIDIHFVRDLVATGAIRVLHVPSRYQYADIFTKGLPTSLFDEFHTSLGEC